MIVKPEDEYLDGRAGILFKKKGNKYYWGTSYSDFFKTLHYWEEIPKYLYDAIVKFDQNERKPQSDFCLDKFLEEKLNEIEHISLIENT